MVFKANYKCIWDNTFNKVEAIKFVRTELSPHGGLISLRDAKFFVDSGEVLQLEVDRVKEVAREAKKYGLNFVCQDFHNEGTAEKHIKSALKSLRKAADALIDERRIGNAIEILRAIQSVVEATEKL